MDGMGTAPAHAKKPATRRDHVWVLAIIAGFALYDVWESWTQVGNKSGFAHGTGWTLTVIVEVFAAYCLYAWFGAPGQRSRRFAMWSAFAALALSLIGQGASVLAVHAVPPIWVRVFVRDLPVITLALIALLVHVRRLDRADAALAEDEAAADDERTALRAQIEAERETANAARESLMSELEVAQLGRSEAERRESEALTRAETLAKKLAAKSAPKARERKRESVQSEDLTIELRALKLLDDEPALRQPRMGGELARKLGVSPATGRRLHGRLTAQDRPADPLAERSPKQSDERSGERS